MTTYTPDGREWDGSWLAQDAKRILRQQSALSIRRLREAIFSALPQPGFLALELGAGGSAWLPFLANAGGRVVGLDLSIPGLLLSREILVNASQEYRLVRGNVLSPPFKKGYFDVVFSAGLVEHFQEAKEVLLQAFDLLRLGGLCITSVPNKHGFPGLMDKWLNPQTYAGHMRHTPGSLAEQHRMAGLEVLSAQYVGVFSFGARAPERGALRMPYRAVRKVVTALVWRTLQLIGWDPESRWFSPSILVVARR